MSRSDKRTSEEQTETLEEITKVVADSGGDPEHPRTRRQMLMIAGGAIAGGAGLVIAGAKPAAAANGDPVIVGQTNTGTANTSLQSTVASNGALTVINNATDGYGLLAAGSGALPDLKLNGTGRLTQFAAGGATSGGAKPTVSPSGFELARGSGHQVWASASSGIWKRINAVRVDNPDGSGASFAPFRLVDTRLNVGGVQGPIATNTPNNFSATASPNIPDDAIAIFCNVTAVSPTFSGWLTVYPQGATLPPVSNVNFTTGQIVANFVFVGLGGGGFTIRPGSGGPTGVVDYIVDIFAYVQ